MVTAKRHSLFLSVTEVRHLTGTKDVEQQYVWLKQHGVRFLVGLDNNPKVLIDTIFQIIGIAEPQQTKGSEPHWDRI